MPVNNSLSFFNSFFNKYKGPLSEKIEKILQYNESNINFRYKGELDCALPGFEKYLKSGYYQYRLGRYLYALRYIKNKCVLDAGCGFGWGPYLISDYPQEIIAIDKNKELVQFAQETWPTSRINFKKHSVLELNSLCRKFDVILGFELIEHLTFGGAKRFLQQVYTALQKRGLFFLSSSFPDSTEKAKILEAKHTYHLKIFTKRELRMLAVEIGLEK